MKNQLYVGFKKPVREEFKTVKNRNFVKPSGGFWTSTYLEEFGSDWVQWCLGEHFSLPEDHKWDSWLLVPEKDAKIYTIDSYHDLHVLMEKYKATLEMPGVPKELLSSLTSPFMTHLDFEKLANDYDGIRLTQKGQWETRFSEPYTLYGWDCESTLWLNYKFEKVEYIGKKIFVDIELSMEEA